MDQGPYDSKSLREEYTSKAKRAGSLTSRNKSTDEGSGKVKEKGEKRSKRRKGSGTAKKMKKEELGESKSTNISRNSSATPDSELRQDQSDSPITDDVFEGSNSSQESETLSMSSLLKSALDSKKRVRNWYGVVRWEYTVT